MLADLGQTPQNPGRWKSMVRIGS